MSTESPKINGVRLEAPLVREALIRRLTALADDEVILAHRGGEWIGHAPILEEDIALANLAQDELGHAGVWLELRRQLDGSDPDALVYRRGAQDYLCAQLLELPRGDWAFTLLRQYLFDAYEALWLEAAQRSTYTPLAQATAKVLREERFHLQHSRLWVERLGLGTAESNRRTQQALEVLWPLSAQLFAPLEGEEVLRGEGIVPDLEPLYARWKGVVQPHLERSGLKVPSGLGLTVPRTQHTEHLEPLLLEMQSVARADPEAVSW